MSLEEQIVFWVDFFIVAVIFLDHGPGMIKDALRSATAQRLGALF